jgi:hypothetical protein
MWVARLLRCQGSAAYIIATTWPPESPLRTSQDKVENEPWEKCARRALAASHHRNRVGPQQRNALSHRAKSRSKPPPSPSIMPLMCPGGILARHSHRSGRTHENVEEGSADQVTVCPFVERSILRRALSVREFPFLPRAIHESCNLESRLVQRIEELRPESGSSGSIAVTIVLSPST